MCELSLPSNPNDSPLAITEAHARAELCLFPDISPAGCHFASTSVYGRALRRGEGSTTGLATIRKVVEEVDVTFTVEDRHHRPVKHVQSGDIVLLEDGKPVSGITGFRQNSDLPLRLALVVDRNDSMRTSIDRELKVAQLFVQRMLRPQIDRFQLTDCSTQSVIAEAQRTRHMGSKPI